MNGNARHDLKTNLSRSGRKKDIAAPLKWLLYPLQRCAVKRLLMYGFIWLVNLTVLQGAPLYGSGMWVSGSETAGKQASEDQDRVLIHYWNFNDLPNNTDFSVSSPELLDVTSLRYGAFISYDGARWDRVNDPTPINAREIPYVEEQDRALRLRNPAGALTLKLPTTGYQSVVLRYAISRTSNGAAEQRITYSVDAGETFLPYEPAEKAIILVQEDYALVKLDFSTLPFCDDNAGFQVRLELSGPGSEPENSDGNQRINHISLEGHALESELQRNLIHYWDFNRLPSEVSFPVGIEISSGGIIGGESLVKGAWIRYDGNQWDRVHAPTSFNARAVPYSSDEDNAIRLRNPSGPLTLRLPTTGYDRVVIRYAVKRTANGAQAQQIRYSVDGTLFTRDGLAHDSVLVGSQYILHEYDFSEIAAVNDNSDFTFRLYPSGPGAESENEDGNQRINHISLDARPLHTRAETGTYSFPDQVLLLPNYPNPFNSSTLIRYQLPRDKSVTLRVYDAAGRKIDTLVNHKAQRAGTHEIFWDASEAASGLYIVRLQAGHTLVNRTILLLR